MIQINGSEAGGQILRTALALSVLTKKPFKITNIRAKRQKPGVKVQHLECMKAIQEICNAEIKGAYLKSKNLTFIPKSIKKTKINIEIFTAGSINLVLQPLLVIGTNSDLDITIKGGATYGKWAPPVHHLENVLKFFLNEMNYNFKINIKKHGFFPKGGALLEIFTEKTNLKSIELLEKGEIKEIKGISVASSILKNKKVAERQTKKANELIQKHFSLKPKIETKYVNSICAGSGLQIWIKTQNSIISGNSLGEIRKSSEQVAEEACNNLIFEYENSVIDSRTADQLLPYLALTSKGKIKTSKITNHIKTNCQVIEQFLPVKFEIKDNLIECRKL